MSYREIAGAVCAPKGFGAGSVYAGIRKAEHDDLTLIVSKSPCIAAGVTTTNQVHAWCVAHNRERLRVGGIQGIICNAGNANACNGERGKLDDLALGELGCRVAGSIVGQKIKRVLTASTGTIGKHLEIERVTEAAKNLENRVGFTSQHGIDVSKAIMTTDLVAKHLAVELESQSCRLGIIAKGSGMIAPNMATMLGFITSDVRVEDQQHLQRMLSEIVKRTFNRVTVDGDTSTNDMVLLLANGESGVTLDSCAVEFESALEHLCRSMAKAIARDGEGATKLLTIRLINPPEGAEKIARTVGESPLVKTACFGNDPNWGRILAATGRAGVPIDQNALRISLAGTVVFDRGEPTKYDPDAVSEAMKATELLIELEFPKIGSQEVKPIDFWSCDLSYDYVKINADYGT